MQFQCPKCEGAMIIVRKNLSYNILPLISIKDILPSEFKRFNLLEIHICEKCGYTEVYLK